MIVQMKVPEVGESIQAVEIAQWLKEEGEWIEQDEDVVEVDSEKASLPIPAPTSGWIVKIFKHDGETAGVGDVIAEIENEGKPGQDPTNDEHTAVPSALLDEHHERASNSQTRDAIDQSDATAGSESRVASDARPQTHSEAAAPTTSEPPTSVRTAPESKQRKSRGKQPAFATQAASTVREEEIVPMSMIRRRIAARLVATQQNSALLTTFNEIDMSAIMEQRQSLRQAFQEQHGVKLGFMSFFVKSAIEALKRFPEVNAEVRGKDVVFRNYYDIGIAIGRGKGLVVPVLRDAEQFSFAEIELAIDDFAHRAESSQLRPDELTGGTFTISNGGIYGSLLSTPLVNPPQSGVLGMHAVQDRPVARKGQVVIRPMMYVALTYDHRIVDGREAVGCLRHIKELIEQPARMLLEV